MGQSALVANTLPASHIMHLPLCVSCHIFGASSGTQYCPEGQLCLHVLASVSYLQGIPSDVTLVQPHVTVAFVVVQLTSEYGVRLLSRGSKRHDTVENVSIINASPYLFCCMHVCMRVCVCVCVCVVERKESKMTNSNYLRSSTAHRTTCLHRRKSTCTDICHIPCLLKIYQDILKRITC